jgi:hypothetical protein
MRKIDHGMAPARDLNGTVAVNAQDCRVTVADGKAEFLGGRTIDANDVTDVAQSILHGFGRGGVDRHYLPLIGKTLVFADAGVGSATLDRQQLD